MYSPKIKEDYIPRLFRLKRQRQIPMTKLVNEIIGDYLKRLEEAERENRAREITLHLLSKDKKGGNGHEQSSDSRAGLPAPPS